SSPGWSPASQGACAFPQLNQPSKTLAFIVIGQTLRCAFGSLAPGASASATLSVTTPSTPGTYRVFNGVASDATDPNSSNDIASTTIVVGTASCGEGPLTGPVGATVTLFSGTGVVASMVADATTGAFGFAGLADGTY